MGDICLQTHRRRNLKAPQSTWQERTVAGWRASVRAVGAIRLAHICFHFIFIREIAS